MGKKHLGVTYNAFLQYFVGWSSIKSAPQELGGFGWIIKKAPQELGHFGWILLRTQGTNVDNIFIYQVELCVKVFMVRLGKH